MTVSNIEAFNAALETAFPDEKRGEWWTLERVLDMEMRAAAKIIFNTSQSPMPRLAASSIYNRMAEHLAEKTVTDLLDTVGLWYKGRGWLGNRLAHRYNVRGDQKAATAAVALGEKFGQMLYRGAPITFRYCCSESLHDWLVGEMNIVKWQMNDEILRKYNRAVQAEGRL